MQVALLDNGIGCEGVEDGVGQAAVIIGRVVLGEKDGGNPRGDHNGQHYLLYRIGTQALLVIL